jgi:hypothetical protein
VVVVFEVKCVTYGQTLFFEFQFCPGGFSLRSVGPVEQTRLGRPRQ